MSTLPDLPFGEIASRLDHWARAAAQACYDGEIAVARAGLDPDDPQFPGTEHWIREKRIAARMAGQFVRFFADLANEDREPTVRAFIDAINAGHGPLLADFLAGLAAAKAVTAEPMVRSAG